VTFNEVLSQTIAMLQQHGRVSYRALKRQFAIDDAFLEDLKCELIAVQQRAVDQDDTVLVWTGETGAAAVPMPASSPAAAVPPPATTPAQEPLAHTPAYLAEKIFTSRSALEGERKQVTVLFADLKGSMELLADRDPEEARQLLDPVLERMMAAVHRYEGTVNQVMGDGIMALFGAPIAHEDHAIRACYAALAMRAAIRTYAEAARRTHGISVQMRVGLNSGAVVVRAIDNDLHMDYSAVGQTTHLAARMEQLAAPGSILLTADTLRLVEGLVQVTALGPIPVKGLPEPVEVFELVGASTLRGRFQARVVGGLTRFVGRETELAALVQALERAGAGHGQVVAAVGEAGVGKSRLVYECVHAHHLQGWRVLESTSVSYGKATPYFPVIDLLRRYTHVEERDDVRTIRAKVTGQVLTLDATLQETIPALLSLLDALPEDSPFRTLDPPQRRQRTLDACKRVLLRESQGQPVLLVFEDLHWIDAETQALLDSLVESLPTAHVLLLINYRPEYQHGWGSKTYYTQLRLDPLPLGSAEALLQALLGEDPSLSPLKRLLIERTEGNPFFLEESVRALVETGVLVGSPGAYRLAQALPTIQMPATVQAVLAARIDRLPPEEKHLVQTAAVIGTEVSLPLVQAIAELPEAAVHRGLAHLQAAEFLYETRLFPEHAYTFKHALTHEVAYSSLLLERRRALHARIVEMLEALAEDRVVEQVEQLAHHAFRGEVWDKALTYYRQAGSKAAAHSAYREAVTCFEQALVVLQHLPTGRDILEQAIDLRFDLRNALQPLGEFGDILHHMREAEPLAKALHDQRRLGRVSAYLSNYFRLMGEHDRAIESGLRAHAIAIELRDAGLQIAANYYVALVYGARGDYGQEADFLRQNVVLLTGDLKHERFGMLGLASVLSHAELAWSLAEVGAFAEGLAHGDEGVRIAEAVDHPYSAAYAYIDVSLLYLRKGELHKAIPLLERGLRLCQIVTLQTLLIMTASLLGSAYALSGRLAEALPLLEQAVEQATSMRMTGRHSRWMVNLSEGYLLAGRVDDAMKMALRALDLSRAHKERGNQAWALRLLGDIAVQREPPECESAEAHYQKALTLAEELGMRPLQAHCHRGLGTLYATTGQREQAHAELSIAIELYKAMDMTFWLPQAEAALAQVEGR
jgi:class 3 adenylate cyclase/tetratricopeptide (TPR) repeat protein